LIQTNGCLLLNTNQTLTLSGVCPTRRISWRYGVPRLFCGRRFFHLHGLWDQHVHGLVCTNGGKTLLFQAGVTNTVADYGALTLSGSNVSNLILRSTLDGTAWKLNVSSLANQTVNFVDVTNSDALVGWELRSTPSIRLAAARTRIGTSSSGTNVWTGTSNTAWALSTNGAWARAPSRPIPFKFRQGSRGIRHWARTRRSTAWRSRMGASLKPCRIHLTVTTNAVLAGALIASGTETITLQADADFTGGSFTPAFSTVSLAGSGAQSINLANLIFYQHQCGQQRRHGGLWERFSRPPGCSAKPRAAMPSCRARRLRYGISSCRVRQQAQTSSCGVRPPARVGNWRCPVIAPCRAWTFRIVMPAGDCPLPPFRQRIPAAI